MSAFAAFERSVQRLGPRAAIVLGSGLGTFMEGFRESRSIAFADIAGLSPATVQGHLGRLSLGVWNDIPLLLFFGRLHFYEGHSREELTKPARIAADLGVKAFVLTNAAGGINAELKPGSLMAIHQHIKLFANNSWQELVADCKANLRSPYSPRLLEVMHANEARMGRKLSAGVYAALTGPSYETPAEIRALAACGADAVGMSTALEAEAAVELGLEVAAISCIANAAAGLNSGILSHSDVLENAELSTQRLGTILGHIVRAV